MPDSGTDDWLAQVIEGIVEPELPIVDAHHHLWTRGDDKYEVEELLSDTGSGHNVVKTCLLYTSPSPRDATLSRMPSSA